MLNRMAGLGMAVIRRSARPTSSEGDFGLRGGCAPEPLQISPALGWNMFWVHAAVLLAPVTLALGALERMLRVLVGLPPEVREAPEFLAS